jgi:5'-3' exonuclease
MKPIYVFDGKPPVLKSEELSRRKKTKEEASESLKEATEVFTYFMFVSMCLKNPHIHLPSGG